MRSAVVLILLLCPVVSAMAQDGFRDDFEGTELAERWEWVQPAEGPTMKVADGRLTVTVPQRETGFNHWVGETDAPLLLTEAPPGNFAVEAHIRLADFGPDSGLHVAVCAASSPRYLVALGPFLSKALYNMDQPAVFCEPTGRGRALGSEVSGREFLVRLERRNDEYTCLARTDANAGWQNLGRVIDPFPPGQVGLVFKTFGEGAGVAAAVEYVAVEPLPEAAIEPAVIRVSAEPGHEIHPYIYGHFIEHLGRCMYGGLWAEMINNRKLTGNARENGVIESWAPEAAQGEVRFGPDNEVWYVGGQSQRIELADGAGGGVAAVEDAGRGRGDNRLAFQAGREYDVRVVLRQKGLNSPVRIALEGAPAMAAAEITLKSDDWETHETRLKAPAVALNGRLAITTTGPGTLWVGCVSLMPADNVEGWRRDVLEACRDLRIPIMRWPGGNFVSGYHWLDGIGPRDKRPPRWERAWNTWEWNDIGTDEFVRLCEIMNWEPYICANAGEADEKEAAAWVEYCNGPADSAYGRLRAENGHPEPFGVKYWSIGNEMYGNWQLGHLDAAKYALKSVLFVRAMRAKDPSLKLIVNGVDAHAFDEWNQTVLRTVGQQCEYLAVHFYQGFDSRNDPRTNYLTVVSSPIRVQNMLAETGRIMRDALGPGHGVRITFDEWNTWPSRTRPGFSSDYAIADGIFAAGIFHAMMRLGDLVTMGNIAQTVNVLGTIQTDRLHVAKTPLALAFELYGPRTGTHDAGVQVECEQFVAEDAPCPALDAAASVSADGRTLYVYVANRHPAQAVPARLELSDFRAPDRVEVARMAADRFDACNPVGGDPQVRLQETTMDWPADGAFTFPPHSVTVLTLRAG